MSEYKAGEFKKYTAVVGFSVGLLGRNLRVGEVIEYDGTKAKFDTGEELTLPNFRSCKKTGWLVEGEIDTESPNFVPYRPKSANIQPRPAIIDSATSSRPDTPRYAVERDENQVVSQIGGQGGAQVGDQNRIANDVPSQTEARVGNKFSYELESQDSDHRVVSSPVFKSGGAQVTAEGGSAEDLKFTKLGSVSPREIDSAASPGLTGNAARGRSAMADIDPEELAQTRAARGVSSDDVAHKYLFDKNEEVAEAPRKKAAKKKTAKAVPQDETVAESTPSGEFVWNTTGHWRTRLKNAMEYKDDPAMMGKIIKAETPKQREKVQKAWSEYLAGE